MLIKIKRLLLRLIGKYPPVIESDWGPVAESARYQGAMNMKESPELKAKVEEMIGEQKARRNYPEAYD